ncbi:MAG: hypothetical protein AAF479_10625 [Pseudomonadota bacterium]
MAGGLDQERIDESAVADFAHDLASLSDDGVAREITSISDRIDDDTSWLEALLAEQRIRARKAATEVNL